MVQKRFILVQNGSFLVHLFLAYDADEELMFRKNASGFISVGICRVFDEKNQNFVCFLRVCV